MSNSPLVKYTQISPNKNSPRNHAIDTITIHCVVGQVSVERLGEIFAPTTKQASSNYGIGVDGRVGMYVEEKDRSWCSSNAANDNRAITIECASDTTHPYAINDTVYDALIDLCADICKRNGKDTMLWIDDKAKAIAYNPKPNEMRMTVHRWFAAKACPGDYIYERLGKIADAVNKKLGSASSTPAEEPKPEAFQSYKVKVEISNLNIRKGPGVTYNKTGKYTGPGVFTIVDEAKGPGSVKGWGKLKSGAGWISLDYATKL